MKRILVLGWLMHAACASMYSLRECKVSQEGAEYMGKVAKTVSGKTCQRWDKKEPHDHSFTDANFPENDLDLTSNYCRNPDLESEGPWCYTTDANIRFEACDIPRCKEVYPECKLDAAGTGYRGNLAVSKSGKQCLLWNEVGKTEDHNYCRNPTSDKKDGPYCYTATNVWEYCDVPLCKASGQCKSTIKGGSYKGKLSMTKSGIPCQRWELQSPHKHSYTQDTMFPDATVKDAGSYCRNPSDSKPDGPWCYTRDAETEWEYCDIPTCENECKKTQEGTEYQGKVSKTKSGKTCQRWDSQSPHIHSLTDPNSFPDIDLKSASNYCRNPDQEPEGPWCYTTDPNTRWEYCDISLCDIDSKNCYKPKATAKHVLHIGLDGFAPCFTKATSGAKNIMNRMAAKGSYTLNARTALKSLSGPGWAQNVCGMNSEASGVLDNGWRAPWMGYSQDITPVMSDRVPLPCVFRHLKGIDEDIRVASFMNWRWIYWMGNQGAPGSMDVDMSCTNLNIEGMACDQYVVDKTTEYLKNIEGAAAHSYTFLHIDLLDHRGHGKGFCGQEYLEGVEIVDKWVGELLDAVNDDDGKEWLVFISSDHGGDGGGSHGSAQDSDVIIPLFVRGPGVKKNHKIQTQVSNSDIVPTLAWAMGYKESPWWTGNILKDAFSE